MRDELGEVTRRPWYHTAGSWPAAVIDGGGQDPGPPTETAADPAGGERAPRGLGRGPRSDRTGRPIEGSGPTGRACAGPGRPGRSRGRDNRGDRATARRLRGESRARRRRSARPSRAGRRGTSVPKLRRPSEGVRPGGCDGGQRRSHVTLAADPTRDAERHHPRPAASTAERSRHRLTRGRGCARHSGPQSTGTAESRGMGRAAWPAGQPRTAEVGELEQAHRGVVTWHANAGTSPASQGSARSPAPPGARRDRR